VADVIPEFGEGEDKKKVTVRDMLNFTAGIPLENPQGSAEAAAAGEMDLVWDLHFRQPLATRPGIMVRYSDVSCRILGKLLERIMGMDLAEASHEYIFGPLGMEDTMFTPSCRERCASTGTAGDGRDLTGGLTQDLEYYMGGVLGSDGLFSTAHDMLVFSEMLMGGGSYGGKRILGRKTVERMTEGLSDGDVFEKPSSYLHYILSGPKTWFWEYGASPYSFFGDLVSGQAIGKMGGAGTFLLLDPAYDLVIIYLTNYGQPENTLEGDAAWNKFQSEIDMMGLCNLVIGNLDV
jgi:CubicO group peptidase (beta-lactamase class C family)